MDTIDKGTGLSEVEKRRLREVKRLIQTFRSDACILLYGSVARGTHGPESDVDLLVLTDSPLSSREEDAIRAALYDFEVRTGDLISTVFFSKDFWDSHPGMPFRLEVDRDAVAL